MPNTPQPALSKPFAKANPEIEALASYAQPPPESYWQKWPNTDLPDCPENNPDKRMPVLDLKIWVSRDNNVPTISIFFLEGFALTVWAEAGPNLDFLYSWRGLDATKLEHVVKIVTFFGIVSA